MAETSFTIRGVVGFKEVEIPPSHSVGDLYCASSESSRHCGEVSNLQIEPIGVSGTAPLFRVDSDSPLPAVRNDDQAMPEYLNIMTQQEGFLDVCEKFLGVLEQSLILSSSSGLSAQYLTLSVPVAPAVAPHHMSIIAYCSKRIILLCKSYGYDVSLSEAASEDNRLVTIASKLKTSGPFFGSEIYLTKSVSGLLKGPGDRGFMDGEPLPLEERIRARLNAFLGGYAGPGDALVRALAADFNEYYREVAGDCSHPAAVGAGLSESELEWERRLRLRQEANKRYRQKQRQGQPVERSLGEMDFEEKLARERRLKAQREQARRKGRSAKRSEPSPS